MFVNKKLGASLLIWVRSVLIFKLVVHINRVPDIRKESGTFSYWTL